MALPRPARQDADMKTFTRSLLALCCLAVAAAAPAQETAQDHRQQALRLLEPLPLSNPTPVTVSAAEAQTRARPRDPDAWNQLGQSLDVAGRYPEAVAAFERATRLPPRILGRAYLYRDLAEAREKVGDLAGALAAARVSLRSWPLSRDGLHCLGSEVKTMARLLVKSGDVAGAAAFYRPLFARDRGNEDCALINETLNGAAG